VATPRMGCFTLIILRCSRELLTRCKLMSNKKVYPNQLLTIGGRIRCNQCQAKSKRSGVQCLGPAIKGKTVCRMHGGRSSGAKTPEGRLRCAQAKTIHGQETSVARLQRSHSSARLAVLEYVGHALGFMTGQKTRGRKPAKMDSVYPELQANASRLMKKAQK